MVTSLPEPGTTPPTHVAAEDQSPPLAVEVKVAGTEETMFTSSIHAGGLTMSEISDFQLNTRR